MRLHLLILAGVVTATLFWMTADRRLGSRGLFHCARLASSDGIMLESMSLQKYAGIWRRLLAYTVDMIPIFGVVFCVAYFSLGFDRALADYFDGDGSYEARAYFLAERNKVRDSALQLWVLYGLIMDCSKFQGTHGKILLNLKVVDETGGRISFGHSPAGLDGHAFFQESRTLLGRAAAS